MSLAKLTTARFLVGVWNVSVCVCVCEKAKRLRVKYIERRERLNVLALYETKLKMKSVCEIEYMWSIRNVWG